MKAIRSAKNPLHQGLGLVAAGLMVSGLLHAAPGGNGGGGGNVTPPPPVPYVTALDCITPGSSMDLMVLGQAATSEAFVARKGNVSISGSFSNPGITINSITVDSATSLTINITVAANAALTTSTLTITNPDGQSATSASAVICVTDIPVINTTGVTPTLASVLDDIEASVVNVTNVETTFPLNYEYAWYEDGALIGHTQQILPASLTKQGSTYTCSITPVKNGVIRGIPASTPAVVVTADIDSNGIHDEWESAFFAATGNNPDADEDGDGLTTRAEYLFGLDPNDARSNRPIVTPLSPQTGEFEYSRAVNKIDGVSYKVWTSPDLVNWTEQVGASESVTQASANSEVVRVSLSPALISANSRLFVRVSVD